MTTKTDGGPAYPLPVNDEQCRARFESGYGGMSLRDYFAAKALPLAFERYHYNLTKDLGDEWHWKDSDWEGVAYLAYGLADAMIKARDAE